jgi:hypothetical protein
MNLISWEMMDRDGTIDMNAFRADMMQHFMLLILEKISYQRLKEIQTIWTINAHEELFFIGESGSSFHKMSSFFHKKMTSLFP